MSRPSRTWTYERSMPVRADAEGLYVPAADLPDAAVGDTVVVSGHDSDEERSGIVADTAEHDGTTYLRLALAPDSEPVTDTGPDVD